MAPIRTVGVDNRTICAGREADAGKRLLLIPTGEGWTDGLDPVVLRTHETFAKIAVYLFRLRNKMNYGKDNMWIALEGV